MTHQARPTKKERGARLEAAAEILRGSMPAGLSYSLPAQLAQLGRQAPAHPTRGASSRPAPWGSVWPGLRALGARPGVEGAWSQRAPLSPEVLWGPVGVRNPRGRTMGPISAHLGSRARSEGGRAPLCPLGTLRTDRGRHNQLVGAPRSHRALRPRKPGSPSRQPLDREVPLIPFLQRRAQKPVPRPSLVVEAIPRRSSGLWFRATSSIYRYNPGFRTKSFGLFSGFFWSHTQAMNAPGLLTTFAGGRLQWC